MLCIALVYRWYGEVCNQMISLLLFTDGMGKFVTRWSPYFYYSLANEVAMGYSNANVRPSLLPSVLP